MFVLGLSRSVRKHNLFSNSIVRRSVFVEIRIFGSHKKIIFFFLQRRTSLFRDRGIRMLLKYWEQIVENYIIDCDYIID